MKFKNQKSKSYYNYFIGNNSEKWASNVHGYSDVSLIDFYDGIDLHFISNENGVKYEFIIEPNSDPKEILLSYSGQKSIKVDKRGNLILKTDIGNVIEEKPYVYQVIDGKKTEIKSSLN